MRTNIQRFRFLRLQLERYTSQRLVIITGARQTGKTTLARATYPDLNYVNLDAIEQREAIREVRTDAWAEAVGPVILDEAQKEPGVFDKVKYAFDAGQITKTVLLGSSQIMMLRKVRETLAGRAFIYELWPLMACEIVNPFSETPLSPPLLDRLLVESGTADEVLADVPSVLIGEAANRGAAALDHLAAWGGMPALLPLSDDERRKWLGSYATAYLERDLGDLARLSDLVPFRQFQRLCALRSGQLLSYSQLGRDAGLSASTSRRYVEYLRLSYQAFLLPPYATNLTSMVVKTPKVYWGDIGLWRELTRYRGPLTGQLFETLVINEVFKWIKTNERDAELTFYRTRSGQEVDLLISTPEGVWGIEVKSARRLATSDWRGLRSVGDALGERWRGGFVVHNGAAIERHGLNLWALPAARLFV
ncbi:MAG: ATP-binding protein [Chloroflexi bacterium]|nr:ATP-binding protein [Chloroflexota bacterium]